MLINQNIWHQGLYLPNPMRISQHEEICPIKISHHREIWLTTTLQYHLVEQVMLFPRDALLWIESTSQSWYIAIRIYEIVSLIDDILEMRRLFPNLIWTIKISIRQHVPGFRTGRTPDRQSYNINRITIWSQTKGLRRVLLMIIKIS